MFDVYWTDHNRELVGERTARKEREREAKAKEGNTKKHESPRHSVATTNSSASSEKGLGLFATRGRKRITAPTRLDYATNAPDSLLSDNLKERSVSGYDAKRLLTHESDANTALRADIEQFGSTQIQNSLGSCSSPSSRGNDYMYGPCPARQQTKPST